MVRIILLTIFLLGICTAVHHGEKVQHKIQNKKHHRFLGIFGEDNKSNSTTDLSTSAAETSAMLATVNQHCVKYKVKGHINDEHDSKVILFSQQGNYTFQEDENGFLNNIDTSKNIIVYISGWTNRVDDERTQKMNNLFESNWNFIVVDTGKAFQYDLSLGSILNGIGDVLFDHGLYTSAALGVPPIADNICNVLIKINEKYPDMLNSTRLVGFSLGAHVAGLAGKCFKKYYKNTKKLPWITALDPAGPCFSMLPNSFRLYATDAEFVDAIHTNSAMLGSFSLVGKMDTYLNIENIGFQPGCNTSFVCSHSRSLEVFIDSIENPKSYIAVNRYTLTEAFVGFGVKYGTYGAFFLNTYSVSPFGMGKEGIKNVTTVLSK